MNWFKKHFLPTVAGMFLLASAMPASALQDIFVFVQEVPGESLDQRYPNWIKAFEFGHEMEKLSEAGQVRPPKHKAIQITKYLDKASPTLSSYCAAGTKIPLTKIEFVKASGAQSRYYQIVLSNVVVTAIQNAGISSQDQPTESVALEYDRIDWTYTEFDNRTGAPKQDFLVYWNRRTNTGSTNNPDPLFKVTKVTLEGGNVRLTWTSVAGKNYSVMSSSTVTGPYNFLKTVASAGTGETSTVITNSMAKEFFIIKMQ